MKKHTVIEFTDLDTGSEHKLVVSGSKGNVTAKIRKFFGIRNPKIINVYTTRDFQFLSTTKRGLRPR